MSINGLLTAISRAADTLRGSSREDGELNCPYSRRLYFIIFMFAGTYAGAVAYAMERRLQTSMVLTQTLTPGSNFQNTDNYGLLLSLSADANTGGLV
jgi:hypothetical protein